MHHPVYVGRFILDASIIAIYHNTNVNWVHSTHYQNEEWKNTQTHIVYQRINNNRNCKEKHKLFGNPWYLALERGNSVNGNKITSGKKKEKREEETSVPYT